MDVFSALPHRYPFLMVDRILDVVPGKSAVALKNLSHGDGVFQGHFPGLPIFPGVLQVECIAQTAGLCVADATDDRVGVLAAIDGARFHRPVRPGDQLRIEAEIKACRHGFAKAEGRILCDGQVVAEAGVTFALVPRAQLSGAPPAE